MASQTEWSMSPGEISALVTSNARKLGNWHRVCENLARLKSDANKTMISLRRLSASMRMEPSRDARKGHELDKRPARFVQQRASATPMTEPNRLEATLAIELEPTSSASGRRGRSGGPQEQVERTCQNSLETSPNGQLGDSTSTLSTQWSAMRLRTSYGRVGERATVDKATAETDERVSDEPSLQLKRADLGRLTGLGVAHDRERADGEGELVVDRGGPGARRAAEERQAPRPWDEGGPR